MRGYGSLGGGGGEGGGGGFGGGFAGGETPLGGAKGSIGAGVESP